ncbi:HAD hydrolase family protein [Gorillibacterium sp. sgz5001074]|uniref:HAD hydrolase family protein n=1 Tax=Gorillibacterium sp. sgz5001074 TaxID=3446695 RepID=UPI003F67BC45
MTLYVLTDLDGTLLRSDAQASEWTRRTIADALHRGAVISYATARGYTSSSIAAAGIPWKYPLVLYNGAMLLDPASLQVLDGAWLDRHIANAIIGMGRDHGLIPYLFTLDRKDRERVFHEKLLRTGELHFYNSRPGDPRFREVKRLECPGDCRALTITYIGLREELEPLRKQAADTFGGRIHLHMMKDNYIPDHYFLEMSDPKANKRDGLLLWARHVGCKPSEVTVFGDNLNDIGLFEAGGTRVAVANAHPDLIRMADHVTGSHNEDGVARYVLERMEAEGTP